MKHINENLLWASADKLRGSVAPSEYMHITLGLIFLKYVSDRFTEKYPQVVAKDKQEAEKNKCNASNLFWIREDAHWHYLQKSAHDENIGAKLDAAFIAIEADNPILKNVLPKIYHKSEIDKRRLGELIDLFSKELVTTDQTGDFMGQVYEYFLSKFARTIGEKGGEFFTPQSIVKLLVAMLNPKQGKIYDPCCGIGGMFVQTTKFIENHAGNRNNIHIYGQEINAITWKLAKMNLAVRGINANLGVAPGDTFFNDRHENLLFDYIIANPPFNISDYGQNQLLADKRWVFGTPPKNNANYAWLSHIYTKLSKNGVAGVVLANGALSTNTKQEFQIRKEMLEQGIVDCIITCPEKLFYTTSIPTSLWIIRKNKKHKDVLFLDARHLGNMVDRRNREFSEADIEKVTKIYHNWLNAQDQYKDIPGFCKTVSLQELKEADYSLVPGRYVGIDETNQLSSSEISREIKKTAQEILTLLDESQELEAKLREILQQEI